MSNNNAINEESKWFGNNVITTVRAIGINNVWGGPNHGFEEIFFIGPDRYERGYHTTKEAILEFIDYWENQIGIAKDYLLNDMNNTSSEWKINNKYEVRVKSED